jgi:hypothetical protein
MPIHDWTRVLPGSFHDFHCSWITHIKEALNGGLLPDEFYALAEQHSNDVIPDVLTLSHRRSPHSEKPLSGGVLLEESPPKIGIHMVASEETAYRTLRRTVVIRHRTGREIVAMIEVVSPGNKSSQRALEQFVDKSVAAIQQGIHLLVIDLHPSTIRDPQGLHGEIWQVIGGDFGFPDRRNLTLASYRALQPLPEAYVEPVSVGLSMPDMPLFLDDNRYIETPLETTYRMAYQGMPTYLQNVLEGREPPESDQT